MVGEVLDLRTGVVVGEDDRIPLSRQPADLRLPPVLLCRDHSRIPDLSPRPPPAAPTSTLANGITLFTRPPGSSDPRMTERAATDAVTLAIAVIAIALVAVTLVVVPGHRSPAITGHTGNDEPSSKATP